MQQQQQEQEQEEEQEQDSRAGLKSNTQAGARLKSKTQERSKTEEHKCLISRRMLVTPAEVPAVQASGMAEDPAQRDSDVDWLVELLSLPGSS